MNRTTQKHSATLGIPRREWESYTLDDIEEIVAFYLGSKTGLEPADGTPTTVDVAIYSLTPEGDFTDISRAGIKMLGYSSKEDVLRVGTISNHLFGEGDAKKIKETIDRQGCVKDYELMLKRNNGEKLYVLLTGRAIYDESGQIGAYRGIIRDITPQKTLEEFNQAMETIVAERTMNIMAMSLADKVRNPATILGLLSEKMMEKEMPGTLKESLLNIKAEAGKLEQIVREFQSMLRDRRAVFVYEDINETLESIIPLIKKEADRKGTKLFPDISEKPLKINMQRDLWRVALLQVARNAIESTPSGGEITIRTYAEKDNVIISVADTGQGIPEDEIERVFDPFFTTKMHRFGMGLSLVKQIVSEHMGTIHLESIKGKGTTFRMVFPARW